MLTSLTDVVNHPETYEREKLEVEWQITPTCAPLHLMRYKIRQGQHKTSHTQLMFTKT